MRRLILALGLANLAALAAAQEKPLHKKVTVKYDHLPVTAVLKDLGDKAGVRFVFSKKLLESLGRVTYEAREQQAARVATRVLRPHGMRLEKAEGSTVAIVKLDRLGEFKVKREDVFDFAQKPLATREGDRVTISFDTKGFGDVTVAAYVAMLAMAATRSGRWPRSITPCTSATRAAEGSSR
ncbi:MAG: hypothetical protein ABSF26_00085 [Thermoguttaceae bacterium]|jgi:type II secretory pathway component GspD/PulD (secretin)